MKNYGMSKQHHPKSIEIYSYISELDFKNGDYFCFKSGGDGDNGEFLMDLLDMYIENNINVENNINIKNKTWQYEKFKGDGAVYAFCPECGYHHCPSDFDYEKGGIEIYYQYHYCPVCGTYLYDEKAYENGYEVIWNERDIMDLYCDDPGKIYREKDIKDKDEL